MCRCAHCHGHYFKLLETRCLPVGLSGDKTITLLYKKRCKRCKMKVYFRKEFSATHKLGVSVPISGEEWEKSESYALPVSDGARMTIFASEYSKRLSRGADKALDYVKQGGRHAQSA